VEVGGEVAEIFWGEAFAELVHVDLVQRVPVVRATGYDLHVLVDLSNNCRESLFLRLSCRRSPRPAYAVSRVASEAVMSGS
jgi:hypothetical protein